MLLQVLPPLPTVWKQSYRRHLFFNFTAHVHACTKFYINSKRKMVLASKQLDTNNSTKKTFQAQYEEGNRVRLTLNLGVSDGYKAILYLKQLTSSLPFINGIFQTRRKVLLDPPFLVNSSNSVTVHPIQSRFPSP